MLRSGQTVRSLQDIGPLYLTTKISAGTSEYKEITSDYFWSSSKLKTPPLLVFQPAVASDVVLFVSSLPEPFTGMY